MERERRLLILILLDTQRREGGECNNTKEGRVIDGSLGIHRAFHFHDINRRSRRVARSRPVSTKGKVYIAYTGLYILVPH